MATRARKRVGWIVLLATTFLTLIFVGVVLAYLDRTVLEGYIVDLVSYELSADGTESTWVYAVTVNDAELPDYALSYWAVGFCDCYSIIDPEDGSEITTPMDITFGCGTDYTCSSGSYTAEDGTALCHGIKYFSSAGELGPDNATTHIFTFTLQAPAGTIFHIGEIPVVVSYGGTPRTGAIQGPICAPNAVHIQSFDVRATPAYGVFGMVLVFVLIIIYRRRR